jgi:hypothetical protein
MLKSNFEKLPLRQKVELYLIVPIIFIIIFIFLEKLLIIEESNIPQEKQQLSIKSLSNKIVVKNDKDIIDYLETQIAKGNIFVHSITTSSQTISLTVSSSLEALMQFLHILEQHLVIEEFSLDKVEQNSKVIKSKVVILSGYFTNQNQKDTALAIRKNPFFDKEITTSQKVKIKTISKVEKQIQVDAIVKNEVLIQGNWYKKGDKFQENTIVQIESSVVKILNNETNKIKIIRLEDEK